MLEESYVSFDTTKMLKEAFDKASPRDYVDTVRISWEESE